MPTWTELKHGFDVNSEIGVPAVLRMPEAQITEIGLRSGKYVMVSAPGMIDAHAVRLRVRSAPVVMPVLHRSDFDSMAMGSQPLARNALRVRSLRLGERLTLLPPMVLVLVIASFAAAAITLAGSLFPVEQSSDRAKNVVERVGAVTHALAKLEHQPLGLASLEETDGDIQRELTDSAYRRLSSTALHAEDQHLGELIEDKLSESSGERMSAQQAAADVRAWSAAINHEASGSTSQWRSVLDSGGKILAGIAGLIAAIIAFGNALPGSLRA